MCPKPSVLAYAMALIPVHELSYLFLRLCSSTSTNTGSRDIVDFRDDSSWSGGITCKRAKHPGRQYTTIESA
ncbi:hypothetical protein BDV37DRAFT_242126 [Aspergillus pseudonomiae]|uniref:Uncharacterized protein n=1 Tax=Aspergillus pseudonomiae TaxID=1506151 RepID=A0A5N7DKB0_9EURO|nr:uncharacterized protein BDV37DRAFT_242126 [Aspergillus pseudonomiae]KAE8406870.1 hypothetical protein BDV37DRAFT_242126 [Aspergillus pseudonomiae]